MSKSMAPGGGGRFQKLEGELSREKGVTNPAALAASIGRKKYHAHHGESLVDAIKRSTRK